MKERTYFKPSNKTVETLIEELDLPADATVPKDLVVAKIFDMESDQYSTLLLERYVNGRTFSKIEELHPDIYYSSTWSACNTAVKNLRNDIIETYGGIESFPLGKYMRGTKLSGRGYLSKNVKDIVSIIKSLNYKPSKDYDRIILGLEAIGYKLDYPKFLLRYPEYPYNLYSHIIQNDGIRPSITAFEIRRRYMKELIINPTHNVHVFMMNVDKLFDKENTLLTGRQKEVTSLYYIKKVRIPDIAEQLSISESLIKLELRKVIHILNTDEGKSFIYNIAK